MKFLQPFEAPIWVAMIGFLFSIVILTKPACNRSVSAFTEIRITDKRKVVDSMLQDRVKQLSSTRVTLETDLTNCKGDADTGQICKEKKDSLKLTLVWLNSTHQELDKLHYYNSDTAVRYYLQYFSIDRRKLDSGLRYFRENGTIPIVIKDSCPVLYPLVKRKDTNLCLERLTGESLMGYVFRNPAAGYTLIICIVQMTLWFLLGALLFGQLHPIAKKDWKRFAACLVTPLLVVGLFVWLFYWYLADEYLIPDNLVVEDFSFRTIFYSIPGYLLAVFCFAVFIYAALKLHEYDVSFRTNANKPANPADDPEFKNLKSLFNTAFIFSAIVLSVFILESGVLLHAVNSMEAMRFYELLSHRPFLGGDSIYMIALLHSILLLIFYIPVMLRFKSLDVAQSEKNAAGTKPTKLFGALWEGLGALLITASPLITGLLQKLLEVLLSD
jgi:hypothetical protein